MAGTTTDEPRAAWTGLDRYVAARHEGCTHEEAEARLRPFFPQQPDYVRQMAAAGREEYGRLMSEPEPAPEAEPEVDRLEGVEEDARRRVTELESDQARLALPALEGDKRTREDARLELAEVEGALAVARIELERVPLARQERVRRHAVDLEEAARQQREAAGREVDKLRPQVDKAAEAFDAAALALARAIKKHRMTAQKFDDAVALASAVEAPPYKPRRGYSAGVRAALAEVQASDAIEFLDTTTPAKRLAGD